MKKTVAYTIFILSVIFLLMNIKMRNEEIWKLRVLNEDLKEQIQMERVKNDG